MAYESVKGKGMGNWEGFPLQTAYGVWGA